MDQEAPAGIYYHRRGRRTKIKTMTPERTKEIEAEARQQAPENWLTRDSFVDGYITAATKYEAEIEAKDIALKELQGISDERDSWNKISVDYAIALEKAEKILTAKDQEIQRLKVEIALLRREQRDIDIDYNFHEGKGENNELL